MAAISPLHLNDDGQNTLLHRLITIRAPHELARLKLGNRPFAIRTNGKGTLFARVLSTEEELFVAGQTVVLSLRHALAHPLV